MTDADVDGRSGTAAKHEAAAARRPRWLWLVSLGVVVVALIVAIVLSTDDDADNPGPAADPPAEASTDNPDDAPDDGPVSEFTGTGDGTTETFDVEDGWEIRWESLGESFQVTLFTTAGESRGVILDRQGRGSGSTYPPSGGGYYLEVAADGAWSIRIFQTTGG